LAELAADLLIVPGFDIKDHDEAGLAYTVRVLCILNSYLNFRWIFGRVAAGKSGS
jgi:hypothetical protein